MAGLSSLKQRKHLQSNSSKQNFSARTSIFFFPFFTKSSLIPKQSSGRGYVHRCTWIPWNGALWTLVLQRHCEIPRKLLLVWHCPISIQGMDSVWGSLGESPVDLLVGRRESYHGKDKEISFSKSFSERSGILGGKTSSSCGCLLSRGITLL